MNSLFSSMAVGPALTSETEFMTTAEVAALVRSPSETVRYWRHVGRGPRSFKVGRRVLYRRQDVEAFLAAAYAEAVSE